ncbi:MauE/DoxX family redox-associated membrane protein [Dactylosporangium sp. NPDC051484]|uniref:MauE/DoxX family redox-associated membrane protein n=1 Tax=Dactylosporangium sp. NPDC051484 TaxID=3154942 RepID=UPI00344FDC39
MMTIDWVLLAVNALLSTVLVRAAAEKLANPSVTAAALREALPQFGLDGSGVVRGAAAIELVAALALAVPVLRRPDAVLVGLLGLVFAVLGAVGQLRGSRQPCGCFGASSARPLGWSNLALGAGFVAAAGFNLARGPVPDPDTVAAGGALLAVIASAGWLFWSARAHIQILIGNLRKGTETTS